MTPGPTDRMVPVHPVTQKDSQETDRAMELADPDVPLLPPESDRGPDTPPAPGASPAIPATPGRRVALLAISIAIVAILAGSGLFVSGYSLGRHAAGEPGTPASESQAFQPFWDTYHSISDRYAGGTVDKISVIQGAIRGMIDSLGDPYSAYLSAEDYRQSLQGISGQFEGIGAEITSRAGDGSDGCAPIGPGCRLVVTRPIPGSPAATAGVEPGDVVLAVDGAAVDGLDVDGALGRIRGKKGTVVKLALERDGRPVELAITRDVVQQEEVETKVLADGAVGYLRLSGFSDSSADALVDALRSHLAAGRDKLILDLRGNPGGYVTAARKIASQFVGAGVLFWEQDAQGTEVPTEALGDGVAIDPHVRLVVLIDHGSASASEIVAGALQDTGRATLVGQQSFGKGTVQQWQQLSGEGGAFKLTVARWLTPDKRWIHSVGLTPDVVVTLPDRLPAGVDPDLAKGLEVLGAAPTGVALLAAA
jgi:carboxyl-terminal processing protease